MVYTLETFCQIEGLRVIIKLRLDQQSVTGGASRYEPVNCLMTKAISRCIICIMQSVGKILLFYEVSISRAYSAAEAIAILKKIQIDILLTDIKMPGIEWT